MHVYLDYNASTPVAPPVVEAMMPWFRSSYANPSSQHGMGRAASAAIRDARETLAGLVGVGPAELFFTSGATEANNMALRGLDPVLLRDRSRIITFETEHPSVLGPLRNAAGQGAKVDILPVETTGLIDLARVEASLGPDVAMVSAMVINNETGVIQPIRRIADLAHSCGALLHSDATQAVGRLPLNLADLGVDMATLSAHKTYGPKGSGALYVRRGTPLLAITHGGGQERGLRSGTENVPAIVGFAAASQWATSGLAEETDRVANLRSELLGELLGHLEGVEPITPASDTAPGAQSPWTLTVRFRGADAEAVIANAPDLAVSAGSACSSGTPEPSHVLMAMLGDAVAASECVRISFGRPTTEAEVHSAAEMLHKSVAQVRTLT
jgi:cysteine desulfurase